MKNITFSKLFNILLLAIAVALVIQRVPVIMEMLQRQGQSAVATSVPTLKDGNISLPLAGKHLMVFWATWCGPCKVELARINRLIKDGALDRHKVIAISISEDFVTVNTFSQEQDYQFLVGLDPSGALARQYKVAGTPTLLLIDETGKINWMTMGLSPSLELRLKHFLQN